MSLALANELQRNTRSGLAHGLALKNLKRADLNGCSITPAALEQLRKERPDIEVVYDAAR